MRVSNSGWLWLVVMYDPGIFLEMLRKYISFPGDGITCTLRRLDCPSKRSSEMSDGTLIAQGIL